MFAAALPVLARVGVMHLVVSRVARELPRDARRVVIAESASLGGARAHAKEVVACDADLRALRARGVSTVDVPITVISGTRPARGRLATRRRECLVEAHERRAATSPHGRHVRAERSTHMVIFSEPRLIADEIARAVALIT